MKPFNKNNSITPPKNRARLVNASLLAAAYSISNGVTAAPITFNTALPVSEGQYLARALVVLDRKSTPAIEVEKSSLVAVLGYGITSKLSVFGVLPSTVVEHDMVNSERRDSALGDAELFGRYEIFRIDKPGATRRITPFVGVRFPTGEQGLTSDGTSDVFAGASFTSASAKQNFEAQIRYDRNGSDNVFDDQQRFKQGDRIGADISWQKRVLPTAITNETKGFWFAVLEANANYSQRNTLNDRRDNDSGGFIASLSPGLQYSTRRWIAELAIRVPIIKNINGRGLEPDYTVFAGLRAKF